MFQKRRLMKIVLSNLKLKDGSLCFSLKKPFNVFAEIGESPKWLSNFNDLRTNNLLDVIETGHQKLHVIRILKENKYLCDFPAS